MAALDKAGELAGFALGHAAWLAANLPNSETLVPLGTVQLSTTRQLLRFEADSHAQAITIGLETLARRQADAEALAFAHDGQIRQKNGVLLDILCIDAWARGLTRPYKVIQPYQPVHQGNFQIYGDLWVLADGRLQNSGEAAELSRIIKAGMRCHPVAGGLWDRWLIEADA